MSRSYIADRSLQYNIFYIMGSEPGPIKFNIVILWDNEYTKTKMARNYINLVDLLGPSHIDQLCFDLWVLYIDIRFSHCFFRYFLERDDVNWDLINSASRSILPSAVCRNCPPVLAIQLCDPKYGVDVLKPDNRGESALGGAIRQGNQALVAHPPPA